MDTEKQHKPPRLRRMALERLKAAEWNPRSVTTEGIGRLTLSLAEFGNLQPITWNARTGHIVAGHQRLACLKAMGHTHTEVWVVDLTPEQEMAANLALNNYAGRFDKPRVRRVLEKIHDSNLKLALTGFDEKEIAKIKDEIPPKAPALPAEKYEVVVECADEEEQKQIYERMSAEGKKCRLLTY
jgi:ParB-like chromosome segregation protein Spo0J